MILTRNPSRIAPGDGRNRAEKWDAKSVGSWGTSLNATDAVINLTGELIGGKRWTKKQKELILTSRLESTRALVRSMADASKKPSVLVNVSGVGFYGDVPSGDVTESFPNGKDFLAEVCARWEAEALTAEKIGVRVVTPRFGVVLDDASIALARMVLPFKLFVGGPIGSGKQWFPWIHREDVVEAILFLLRTPAISRAVNVVAPEAVTMKEFSKKLGEALRRPSWAPVPSPVLRVVLGEMAEMVLTGQRVVPKKLLEAGYEFRFPHLPEALHDIIRK